MEIRLKENIVDSRIKKVLQTQSNNKIIFESFEIITEILSQNGNNIKTRNNIKNNLEKNNLNLTNKYLNEYNEIINKINIIDNNIIQIENECKEMSFKVNKANNNIQNFMLKANELENKRNLSLKQSHEIEVFLSRFQLTNEEINTLYNYPLDCLLNEPFLNSLKRLKIAYNECKLMIENHQYNVGYELLDSLGYHQNIGYQRLYEWVKIHCDKITTLSNSASGTGLSNNLNGSSNLMNYNDIETEDLQLQLVLQYLKDVPSYFTQCQELVISSRRHYIIHKFILQITQQQQHIYYTSQDKSSSITINSNSSLSSSLPSSSSLSSSYDIVRYVGDMLACVHQIIVSEEEFLRGIFQQSSTFKQSIQHQDKNNNEIKDIQNNGNNIDPIYELLSKCLNGLGRPLKIRLVQIIENNNSLQNNSNNNNNNIINISSNGNNTTNEIEKLYKIYDLILFYLSNFIRIIKIENVVKTCLNECLLICYNKIQLLLQQQTEQLNNISINLFAIDTATTQITKEHSSHIHQLLIIYNTSLILSILQQQQTQLDLQSDNKKEYMLNISNILETIIHSLLHSFRICGNAVFQENIHMALFMINNVNTLKNVLVSSSKLSLNCNSIVLSFIDLLNTEIESWKNILIKELLSNFLMKCQMDNLTDLIDVFPPDLIGSEQSSLQEEKIIDIIKSFYSLLFLIFNENLYEKIEENEIKEIIRKNVSKEILFSYKKVYKFVYDPKNKYLNPSNILTHSVNEVSVLLGTEDDE